MKPVHSFITVLLATSIARSAKTCQAQDATSAKTDVVLTYMELRGFCLDQLGQWWYHPFIERGADVSRGKTKMRE